MATGTDGSAALSALSGLEQLQAIRDGKTPPPSAFILFPTRIVEVEAGRVVLESDPPQNFGNPKGDVHGGYAMSVLVSALACTVQSALAPGLGFVTLETKVNFGKSVHPTDGPLRTAGSIVQIGRKAATAEARMVDQNGEMKAMGIATFLVLDGGT